MYIRNTNRDESGVFRQLVISASGEEDEKKGGMTTRREEQERLLGLGKSPIIAVPVIAPKALGPRSYLMSRIINPADRGSAGR